MKTTLLYRLVAVFMIVPLVSLANNNADWKGKYTKDKTIHKEYDVNSNATVRLSNAYGDLDITTWDQNRVVIDVTITVNGNNEEKVDKRLEEIDVDFSASNEWVSAETKYNKRNSKRWWSWGGDNVNIKIDYVVKMPMSNNVKLMNDYGNINLDKLEGRAEINCDYGKITTKELMASNNKLNFDYTKNSYFEYIKSAEINADYSGYTVGKAETLEIIADYTDSNVEMAEDVSYNCDYGSLEIENANNVSGNGDYLTLRLGTIYQDVRVDGDYGSMKIEKMASTAGDIYVESDYMKITIGYDPGYSFEFDIDLQYASVRGIDDFEITKQRIESRDKYYFGYHGDQNSSNKVTINSEYGSVTFNKN